MLATMVSVCNCCSKNMSHSQPKLLCCNCNLNYHTRCVYTNANVQDWLCFYCTGNIFPFNHYVDDDEFRFAYSLLIILLSTTIFLIWSLILLILMTLFVMHLMIMSIIYCKNWFSDRVFYVTIADADIRSLKSLHTLFDKYSIQKTSIFQCSKHYGSPTCVTRLKDAVNMADLISLIENSSYP